MSLLSWIVGCFRRFARLDITPFPIMSHTSCIYDVLALSRYGNGAGGVAGMALPFAAGLRVWLTIVDASRRRFFTGRRRSIEAWGC